MAKVTVTYECPELGLKRSITGDTERTEPTNLLAAFAAMVRAWAHSLSAEQAITLAHNQPDLSVTLLNAQGWDEERIADFVTDAVMCDHTSCPHANAD